MIIYRLYLPEGDEYGGAGLPTVTYGTGEPGDPLKPPLPSCQDPVPVESGTVNDALREVSAPAAPAESAAPQWGISRSRPETKSAGPVSVRTGGAFFPNFHVVYLSLLARRDQGEVVAFRAKAPSFVQTRGAAAMPSAQLRYFSICVNDFPTTRYVACLPDDRIAVDEDGFFTIVVSDTQHKPAKLGPSDNWIPAGPYPDTFVLYRQMLPAPGFAEAIELAPSPEEAPRTTGAYYPQTKLCTAARFDRDRCGLPVATANRPPPAPKPPAKAKPRKRSRPRPRRGAAPVPGGSPKRGGRGAKRARRIVRRCRAATRSASARRAPHASKLTRTTPSRHGQDDAAVDDLGGHGRERAGEVVREGAAVAERRRFVDEVRQRRDQGHPRRRADP